MKPKNKTKHSENNSESAGQLPETELRAQIEKRAYELWMADGCRHGEDQRHWLEAEKQIREEAE